MFRHSSLRIPAMFAALLVFVSVPPVAVVDAWIGPTEISDRAGSNVALVLGPTGKPHIGFPSELGVHYMTRAANAWVRTRVTRQPLDEWTRIALDGAGHVHITFHRTTPCEPCTMYPSKGIYHATNETGSWVVERLTTNPGDFDASVAARGDKVDVVFGRDGVGIVHMRHVTGVSGWTTEVAAPEPELSYFWAPARPALAVDDDGYLGLAYAAPGPDAEGGDLYHGVRYSTTRGGPDWTRTVVSLADDYNVNLAIDNADVPHIVFVRDKNFSRVGVVYAKRPASTWTKEIMAPFGGFPYITTDAQRHPFVAWADEQGVIISRKLAGSWGYKALSTDFGYSPDPKFAPDGTLRIAYTYPGVMWLRELP